MSNEEIRNKIADYVIGDFGEEIESVEENCGSLWLILKNKEVWYVQVGLCDKEDEEDYIEEKYDGPTLKYRDDGGTDGG